MTLWDVEWETPGHPRIGLPIRADGGPVAGVAFGGRRDRRLLASAGQDGTVLLVPADVGSWIGQACSIANRNLNAYEWDRFIGPGRRQQPTCP